MSIFNNGNVKLDWYKTNGTSEAPIANNYYPHLECSSSRQHRSHYENVLCSVMSDHNYAGVRTPLLSEESRRTEGIFRSKMYCEMRNSHLRRDNKPYLKQRMINKNLSTEQIISLEAVFQRKPHVTFEERITLAERLQIDINVIKIWFRNRRQSTNRLDRFSRIPDLPSSDESTNSHLDRLTLIELRIKENTDIFGYVTLDDDLMNSLVCVINECLSKTVHYPRTETPTNELRYYEPVSPVTLSEDSDDKAPWENLDPEANLQRLMDIQTVISRTTNYI